MRRSLSALFLVLILLVSNTSICYASDNNTPKVLMNGKQIGFGDQDPIKESTTVLMNADPILSSFGIFDAFFQNMFKDKWDSNKRTGLYKLENGSILGYTREGQEFQILSNVNYFIFDGQKINIDYAPRMVDDKLFIPLSLIQAMFSYREYLVSYDPNINVVAIYHTSLKNPFQELSWATGLPIENSSNNNTTTIPIQQESDKLKTFKKEIEHFLGKNIWYRQGIAKDSQGNYLEKLSPVWILKVTENGSFYTLHLKSGEKTYTMDYIHFSTEVYMNFLDYNPYTTYKWTDKVWDHIKKDSVFIGMNQDMVSLSLGIPTRKNITTYSWGVMEQWVYDYKSFGTTYLYFKNGILTSFQQTK
ncbi:hypothetical protein BRE01_62540 [Brevibacillus reuszeri]|uniref:Copper amine oxidase-like N-terminal domain-containing protein n=1 Tax=Brevibacillus reuszeri TaxID=54915 RepID=A0A0K9YW93_9BACL|nr:hypothetical protein [Brevibacillus reuszeri]KNB72941.1 hypothetical protein ADS79_14040 [Brevibacillus reuszeri]GED72552.1 hypothetical protein BRE01_62540 [Brevibacillus reuszeri]